MGIVQRNSITITILSYLGILIGYVNKILLLTNFLTEEQVGLVNILTGLAVLYAQFSALGINFSVVKFFPFFRTPDRRDNGFFFWSALGSSCSRFCSWRSANRSWRTIRKNLRYCPSTT